MAVCVVRGIIAAEEHQIGTEVVDPGDQAAHISVRKPETVMDIAQVNNTEIVGFQRKIIRFQLTFFRSGSAGFQQGIADQTISQDQAEDQPAAVTEDFDLVTAAAERGGGHLPGGR